MPIPDFRGSRRASILMLTRKSNVAKTGVSSAAKLGHESLFLGYENPGKQSKRGDISPIAARGGTLLTDHW
jgi:hypothetical protein